MAPRTNFVLSGSFMTSLTALLSEMSWIQSPALVVNCFQRLSKPKANELARFAEAPPIFYKSFVSLHSITTLPGDTFNYDML